MGTRLGLKANDLICFAVIYGFSMDGESQFKGNLNYLAACMFATQPTVILALNHLLECNLILKQDDVVKGKKRCYYSTNVIYNEGKFEVIDTTKEPLVMTTKESLVMTTKESLVYNNKEYNNKENKKRDNNKSLSPKNKRFVKPTINQIDEYIREKGMHFDAERFFDYYESKGWMVGKSPMKDWKAACRTWESQRKHEFKEEQTEESGIVYPDGIDENQWTKITFWLCGCCHEIAGYISPTEFAEYKKRCKGDSKLLSEILKEINSYVELHGRIDISEKFDEFLKKHLDNEQETGD
jgi:hypothetical protein